ncbi:MAG TPA: hypothetical protein PLL76_04840 [Thermoanaerobaculia bacterium]|nr:hypothetical protein [Thermoanaerobaculia bacterium]
MQDPDAVDVLGAIRLPSNWNEMIRRNAYWLTLDWGNRRAHRDAIERASAKYHAHLSGLEVPTCSDLRRNILKAKDWDDLRRLLKWLTRPGNCDPATLAELTRGLGRPDQARRVRARPDEASGAANKGKETPATPSAETEPQISGADLRRASREENSGKGSTGPFWQRALLEPLGDLIVFEIAIRRFLGVRGGVRFIRYPP